VNPTSGEESFARLNGGDILVEGPANFPAQFELGADARHNWQRRIDEKIKLTVVTTLHWDLAVPCDRVQVSVSRGWVTLTGRVTREYEKARAEADARSCSGVAGVTNRLSCEVGN
jgi:osmotically-inducible protein OsmY